MSELICRYCAEESEPILYWHTAISGMKHLGARCRHCGRWIKWVPQSDEWLALAPPADEAQGALL